jgi:hypothetical protein
MRYARLHCALAVLCTACLATQGLGAPTVDDLFIRYAEQVAKIRSVQSEYVLDQRLERIEEDSFDSYRTVRAVISGEKVFRDVASFFKSTDDLSQREIQIWNGETQYILRNSDWSNPASKPELNVMAEKARPQLFGPEFIYLGLPGSENLIPFESLKPYLQGTPVVMDSVKGEECYLLQGMFKIATDNSTKRKVAQEGDTYKFRLWLSAEHCLPLQYERDVKGFKRPELITDIHYEKYGDAYYPLRGIRYTLNPNVSHVYVADREKTIVNAPVSDSTFVPKLEPGTFVWDYILDAEYLHLPDSFVDESIDQWLDIAKVRANQPDGGKGDLRDEGEAVTDGNADVRATSAENSPEHRPRTEPSGSRSARFRIFLIGLAFFGVLLFALHRRRRMAHSSAKS